MLPVKKRSLIETKSSTIASQKIYLILSENICKKNKIKKTTYYYLKKKKITIKRPNERQISIKSCATKLHIDQNSVKLVFNQLVKGLYFLMFI